MHILIVEDESLIARFLAHGLQAEGFDTVVASDGGQAIELLASHRWDLVVLDLLLPVADGFAVLAAAQQDPEPPRVLVLSARHSVETKVAALNGGACDYLAKPFSFDELVARVRVHLRVAAGPARVAASVPIELDPQSRSATVGGGRCVSLSAREFAVLAFLARRPGEVVSRERLLSGVWQYQFDPRSNIVDVYVGRLRRKLGALVDIDTVRGGGYVLRYTGDVARERQRDDGSLAEHAADRRLASVGVDDRVDDRES